MGMRFVNVRERERGNAWREFRQTFNSRESSHVTSLDLLASLCVNEIAGVNFFRDEARCDTLSSVEKLTLADYSFYLRG